MTDKAIAAGADSQLAQAPAFTDIAAIQSRLEHAFGNGDIGVLERAIITAIVSAWTEVENG